MKTLKKIWGIGLLVTLLVVAAPRVSFAQGEYITEQDFYDALAPYGTWVYDNNYGDVWLPDVDETFRPYQTAGYWIMTEYGNTWVSDYAWGWATFHYGRWRFDDYYGWEWIPGYEWAPAWVSWRSGGGYYGWAPLSPDIDFNMSFGSGNYNAYWAFAPAAYIYSPSLYNYYVPRSRAVTYINRTRIINNVFVYNGRNYVGGPRASDVQRYTHKRPTVYQVTNASRPGSIAVGARSVSIFKPRVNQSQNARPQLVVDAKAYQQQNPNVRIARGSGSLTFNRDNAQRLAQQVRNTNTSNSVIRVNPQGQQNQQPGQLQSRRPQQQSGVRQGNGNGAPPVRGNVNTTRQNQANPQQNNNGQQRTPYRGRPENRPNVAPARTQDNNAMQQQQATQQAQQQQAEQQRRTQYDQQRQQQAQQQKAQQAQQQQFEQQRRAQYDQQKQQQAQQQAAQQAQQQQAEQQRRAQFEQQRQQQVQQQAAQQAQQQQAEQQRRAQYDQQKQQQAQQQQAEQQRRAQFEQQRQQQAQQQAAQQAAQQRAQQQAQQQAAQQAAQQRAQQQAQQQAAQQAAQRQAQQQAAQQAAQQRAQQEAQQRQQQQQQQDQQRRRPPGGNQ